MALADSDFDGRFGELYRVAYRVGYRLLGRHEAAQDVAQEALTRAFVHWKRVDRHPDPEAWVARVSSNLACDAWRRATPPVPPRRPGETDEPQATVDMRIDLHAALNRLPKRQREVIVLRYLADLPERSVATALGCSSGSAKQHATRALNALRSYMLDPDAEVTTDVRTP